MRKSPQPLTSFGQGYYISNQLGRRNLNPNQIAYLRGKRYETEKKLRGGDGTNQFTKEQMGQCDPIPIRTSQKLADEYGVAERTIRREGNFSKVVDILPEPKKEEVLSGKDNFGRNETSKILKMDKPTQKKFIKEVESGTPIKEASCQFDNLAKPTSKKNAVYPK